MNEDTGLSSSAIQRATSPGSPIRPSGTWLSSHRYASSRSSAQVAWIGVSIGPGAIEQAGGRAVGVPADLADPATPARVISAALKAFGRVDGLVNNAAACRHFPLPEWEVAGFD